MSITTQSVGPGGSRTEPDAITRSGLSLFLRRQFISWGILPILLVTLVVVFAIIEPRFLSADNIVNVSRQVSYLAIVVVGQMLYLVSRNYDLSNGATVALSSIVTASIMSSMASGGTGRAIAVGVVAGILVGGVVGVVNGVLVAIFKISSFIVTLGVASVATGLALLISGGVPVTGLPPEFSRNFGTSRILGIPFPVVVMIIVLIAAYVLLNWTKLGRQTYAVGGNDLAAFQSGVNVRRTLLTVMAMGSLLAGLVGVMITARVATGEANIGVQYPLLSIVAAVLGGVSLYGGEGRVAGAFLGALFIVILSNGMDLIRVQSYVQQIVLGVLLITALLVDRLRTRLRST